MTLDGDLKRLFGFDSFRPGQGEAARAAVAGRDTLVVMPTGSGKSLCYQLPALVARDLTVVVSPLVSLMQDQVEQLAARGHGGDVARIDAQQATGDNARVLERAVSGDLRLLYVAPERFAAPGFLDRLAPARVGLFVVDEAHCVSQWGHDFRPDYLRLADAASALGARCTMATTATATPRVANDVSRRLGLRDPVRVVTGFDRPNLSFCVVPAPARRKRALLLGALRAPDALPAIVYAGTRAGAEELAADLTRELGEPAIPYHAGLEREPRAEAQRRFISGEARVVVATNAFGMGIDKADVRTVVHHNVPASLEAWYQEAGRAGRDGRPSLALLLAEARDKALHVHFIKRDEASAAVGPGAGDATRERWRRYREIWSFVDGSSCRRRAILRHFGDPAVPAPEVPCCDVCDPALAPVAERPSQAELGSLDDAIFAVARDAQPSVGRTGCAEILHGAQSQKIARNSYDGLPGYGTQAHRARAEILERIDELLASGELESSGGRYPVIRLAARRAA